MKKYICMILLSVSIISYSQNKIKVACVGNSITYGTAVDDREVNCYPAKLQKMLGDRYEVHNFGKPGATLLKKGHRPYDKQEEFEKAIKLSADIVVIHLGINDTDPRNWPNHRDDFVEDYLKMIFKFKLSNPNIRIIVCRMTPISDRHHRFLSGTRDWHEEIQQAIERVADISDVQLTDLHDVLYSYPHLLPDALHPNVEGAEKIAKKIYGAIIGDYGGLRMSEIYSDNMMFQRNEEIKISGIANADEKVKVSIGNQEREVIADKEGAWSVCFMPLSHKNTYTLKISTKDKALVYNNILVGEVWLCSGQSNMEFTLKESRFLEETKMPFKQDSKIRIFDMKARWRTDNVVWDKATHKPINDLQYFAQTKWAECGLEEAKRLSAIGYHFAKILRDSIDLPIGIICNAVGGSPTEAWIDRKSLEFQFPEILKDWSNNDFVHEWVRGRAEKNISLSDDKMQRHPYHPAYLYEAGMQLLKNYNIAGVLWYQGESNAHNKDTHTRLFNILVDSWQKHFNKQDLPFYYVQLSSFNRDGWTWFRDSQTKLDNGKNVRMVVSTDCGEENEIHYKNKKPVAERLAKLALQNVYSLDVNYTYSPVKSAIVNNDTVIISFDDTKQLKTSDGKEPSHFEIAHHDGLFSTPFTKIVNNKVMLWNPNVKSPRYVRYGWYPYAKGNLTTDDDLPVSSFRMELEGVRKSGDVVGISQLTPITRAEKGFEKGVSAAFVGVVRGHLVVAGGCNFPNIPVAEGGKKIFYKGIYAKKVGDDDKNEWTKVGELPHALAYGGMVSTDEGIVMIGGNNSEGAFSDVYLLDIQRNKSVLKKLPSLPYTSDNLSATSIGRKVYICGGNMNGFPSNNMAVLDLDNIDIGWKQLKPFPEHSRVQPVCFALKDKSGETCLYVFGGFSPKQKDKDATLSVSGYKYSFKNDSWIKVATPKGADAKDVSLGGGVSVAISSSKAVAMGGVNKDIFLSALQKTPDGYLLHPKEWYKFNKKILIYDSIYDCWREVLETEYTARAGASIVFDGVNIYHVNGETKPGIRTPDILKLEIKTKD